jgi:hypothetical protein
MLLKKRKHKNVWLNDFVVSNPERHSAQKRQKQINLLMSASNCTPLSVSVILLSVQLNKSVKIMYTDHLFGDESFRVINANHFAKHLMPTDNGSEKCGR